MTIRLIDANKLKESLKQNLPQYMHREMLVTVNIQPTIDAVVVTRCKDCRHAEYNSDFDEYRCGLSRFSHDGDYYCADAELKDELFDKDINVRSKDEPQTDIHGITDCDFCKHGSEEWDSEACDGCCNANNHFEPKDEPQFDKDINVRSKDEPQLVKESVEVAKDLVKAFCEDGTWLERQGVYTLTLAEAKQRAVDIIESVMPKDEPQTEREGE